MTILFHPQSHAILSTLLELNTIQQYLTSLREHHLDTYQHSLRVGLLCLDIGLEWQLKRSDLNILGVAGLLHDVGKRRIPREILSKASSLNKEEKQLIRQHPRFGFLELDESDYEAVRKVVIAHHEFKIDPYPRQGNDRRRSRRKRAERRVRRATIDELSQILCVADIYDALASPRAYKAAMPKKQIEEMLRAQFTGDEQLIDVVLHRFEGHNGIEETVESYDDKVAVVEEGENG